MPIETLTQKLYQLVLTNKISASEAFRVIDSKLTQEQVKSLLKSIWKFINWRIENMDNKDQISIIWHIDDVIHCAKDNGIKITKKQAREVLECLRNEHDATIGINWDVILYWIEEITK
jgi:hypothetical protein